MGYHPVLAKAANEYSLPFEVNSYFAIILFLCIWIIWGLIPSNGVSLTGVTTRTSTMAVLPWVLRDLFRSAVMLYFYFRFDIDINKNEEVSSQEDRVSGFRIGLMFDRFFGKPYVCHM